MLITIIEAIILGIIQGATEFIPISSSAHLIIVPWLFGWTEPALTSLPFDVALHLGTLLAVLIYFAGDWLKLIRGWFCSIRDRSIQGDPYRREAWFVILGTIPGAIAGFLGESKIDALFHAPGEPLARWAVLAIAALLVALGVALWLADRLAPHWETDQQLTLKQVLIIGFAQAFAILPGVSRSGSTITAGLATGLKRDNAARFSFLLSAPIIAGAGAKSLLDVVQGAQSGAIARGDLVLFPIGMIVAAVSGYLCIRFLLNYLRSHTVSVFVLYRFALAALIVIVAFLR